MRLRDMTESASAGATGAGSIAASPTGFASGGIGTTSRAGGVTVTGVKQRKRKGVAEDQAPIPDHEVHMAHADVKNLAGNSVELYQLLKDVSEHQGLPGWIQSYITLSNDYIESVIQYMRENQEHQNAGVDHD